ncbi:MAG: NBR1-Ig-like domain-containing protein [Anaerolineae bacterium]
MRCPHCGAQLPEGARFCARCGKALPVSATEHTCPHCGQPVGVDEAYCPHCGQPMASSEAMWGLPAATETAVPTKQPRGGPAVLAWVLMAVAVLVIIISGLVIAYVASPRVQEVVAGLLSPGPTATAPKVPAKVAEGTSTTAGPSPTPTPPPTQAQTLTPTTATLSPSPSLAASPTPAETGLASTFVADVTVPDGTEIAPGATFVKTWRVRNDGDVAWPTQTHLRHMEDESFGADLGEAVGPVEPGQEVDVSLTLTAPEEPGSHVGIWQLHDDSGEPFGTRLTVLIAVPGAEEAATPSVTPEGTPSASPTPSPAALVTVIYEYGWAGGWMGITNQGKWLTASNGRAYSAQMGLLDTPAMRKALAEMMPNGWRLKIMVRPELTYEGWTMGCASPICQAHTSDAGQQLIINHVYLDDATWKSFVDDWLAGGSQRVIQNEQYEALQEAVFAPLNETPTTSCIGFKFVAAD